MIKRLLIVVVIASAIVFGPHYTATFISTHYLKGPIEDPVLMWIAGFLVEGWIFLACLLLFWGICYIIWGSEGPPKAP